ncbi:MAG: copper oxidase [Gammaproteobacteria bacterium]
MRSILLSLIGIISMLGCATGGGGAGAGTGPSPLYGYGVCNRRLTADVVALNDDFVYNRMGAWEQGGMLYALKRDTETGPDGLPKLRSYKRARPIVLRMNQYDCLTINLTNGIGNTPKLKQSSTRQVSMHVTGLQVVESMKDDGSFVGTNPTRSALANPGETVSYTLFAGQTGGFIISTGGDDLSGQSQQTHGLFGMLNVEPADSEWYRSQVTYEDLCLAAGGTVDAQEQCNGAQKTPHGQPLIKDYKIQYPQGSPRQGPILAMLDDKLNMVHSDLTAIITYKGVTAFPKGTFPPNPAMPDREEPWREITTIYHDASTAQQAFTEFTQGDLSTTLGPGGDFFAINYGMGGIGAEILANRLGRGPMKDCVDCRYEEFFLTSWAVGDSAMVVDNPAGNVKNPDNKPATVAYYPDDPSNVYHSYLGDHVTFQIGHGGFSNHHVHHQHAHQWLHTPNSSDSHYLDSQTLGPGASYTLEMVYAGSGNVNLTPGDSIFHCHFYPHFAGGMWAMWRVHDVFEWGTQIDSSGKPIAGARALPDGEITTGTAIPALVPLPGKPMAPMPAKVELVDNGRRVKVLEPKNPGYPFFVPGRAAHRPPKPPLDTVWDGGLPRHVVVDSPTNKADQVQTQWNFSKDLTAVAAQELAERGTPEELAAMEYHAQKLHKSSKPDGSAGDFRTNGQKAVPGAPYADPCVNQNGTLVPSAANPRVYEAAVIQLDVILNKDGWHYPQQRMIALNTDVKDILAGNTPPHPFFIRANSHDCIQYWHTNLVPDYYEPDDFQVRTPTDVLGQHIHLVKFDVTSSDGAANGFNYEDGTLSPEEVQARIEALGKTGFIGLDGQPKELSAKDHPYFGKAPFTPVQTKAWKGAQTTVQRWYADPLLGKVKNVYTPDKGQVSATGDQDRTLRTVFTHDHFGPSTHQQAGLYAGLLIEPKDSKWYDPEDGKRELGTKKGTAWSGGPVPADAWKKDGGPTDWQANIVAPVPEESYREFAMLFQDLQLAYDAGSKPTYIPPALTEEERAKRREPSYIGYSDCTHAINPVDGNCSSKTPTPVIVSGNVNNGTSSVNYRNEPIPLRVNKQSGDAADLSYAYASIDRPSFNYTKKLQDGERTKPVWGGVGLYDPYTPMLRAYAGDQVQVRVLAGAHVEAKYFTMSGLRWHPEPSFLDSGFRAGQVVSLSEHFEILFKAPPIAKDAPTADFLYLADANATFGIQAGIWGMLRTYSSKQDDLVPLPNNPNTVGAAPDICPSASQTKSKYNRDNPRKYYVAATPAQLVFNSRDNLANPYAVVYRVADENGTPLSTSPSAGPLVLRAAAGDCVEVHLFNKIPASFEPLTETVSFSQAEGALKMTMSTRVGLRPQLVSYDVLRSDGVNVGNNGVVDGAIKAPQTIAPNQSKVVYRWFAGNIIVKGNDATYQPVEFGGANLFPSDPFNHASEGMFGAVVVEPAGSWWANQGTCARDAAGKPIYDPARCAPASGTDATILSESNQVLFDEFVASLSLFELKTQSGFQSGVDFGTDPIQSRYGSSADLTTVPNMWQAFSDSLPAPAGGAYGGTDGGADAGVIGPPATPTFVTYAGRQIRIRLMQNAGNGDNVFTFHGHMWQERPYADQSTTIAASKAAYTKYDPKQKSYTTASWKGARMGLGPAMHYDIVIASAGGINKIPGDYLYRTFATWTVNSGLWGIVRALPEGASYPQAPAPLVARAEPASPSARRGPRDRERETPARSSNPLVKRQALQEIMESGGN